MGDYEDQMRREYNAQVERNQREVVRHLQWEGQVAREKQKAKQEEWKAKQGQKKNQGLLDSLLSIFLDD